MKQSRDILGLYSVSVTVCILSALCAVFLTACSTTAKLPPIDDTYYWSENTQIIQNVQSTPNTPSTPKSPSIEYLNVQDTTVTIRVKR